MTRYKTNVWKYFTKVILALSLLCKVKLSLHTTTGLIFNHLHIKVKAAEQANRQSLCSPKPQK